jgi:DNA-binding response OmpR family regulator
MNVVFLVEDDEVFTAALAAGLKVFGWSVRSASTARAALRALGEFMPDVLLLDLALPDMDGADLLETIRKQADWKDVPVVVLSGAGDLSRMSRLQSLTPAAFLTKSTFSIQALSDAIRRIVGG